VVFDDQNANFFHGADFRVDEYGRANERPKSEKKGGRLKGT
jgi:hypothetical protein